MTIQELKDLVRLKIAGQGTMVDAGGALPPVLNGILDTLAATQNVESVVVTVDGGEGTPSADATFADGVLTLAFHNLKGEKGDQGNTGSSVDYPFELVNNVTTDDATKALSAAQGVVLDGKISQLGQDVGNIIGWPQYDAPTVSTAQYPARRDGSTAADTSIHGYMVDLTLYPQYKEVTFRGICKAGTADNKVVAGIFVDANGVVLKEITGNVAMNTWTSDIPTGAVKLWASYLYSGGMPQSVTFSAIVGEIDKKADRSSTELQIPFVNVMSRFYLNRVSSTSNFYIVGKTPLTIGQIYKIVFKATRSSQSNLHLAIVNTPTPDVADIVVEFASFNQDNSPFNGTFEYTPDVAGQYVCVWAQGAGVFDIIELSVNKLTSVSEISEDLVGFKNYDLYLSAKKRYLTSAQQTALGLTPSVKYNGISNLIQFAHISDLHQDMNRFARAIKFCKENGIMLINTGDTVKQDIGEALPSFNALLDGFDGPYIHCVGNHDSWGTTLQQSVYNKFISPFASKYGWALPSGVDFPTFFLKDDAVNRIRYVVLDQWEKYGVGAGGTHISQTQADFFVNALQTVPAGYAVIVVEHTPNNSLTKDADYPKFFQEPYSGTIGEASTKMVADIVDAWISGTSIAETYNINGEISISADFSQVASHEFIAFVNGHTHGDAVTYLSGTTNLILNLNVTTGNCYIAPISEGVLAEQSDLYRDTKSELQDAFNVYLIDRDLKVVKVVRIGSDRTFNFDIRDCMVIPYAN